MKLLHQNPVQGKPIGEDFNYAEEFKKLDLQAIKQDLYNLMTATRRIGGRRDYGTMASFHPHAWHSAVTYRMGDGRGGAVTARSGSRRSTAGPTT
jgi:catalase-peroxidase